MIADMVKYNQIKELNLMMVLRMAQNVLDGCYVHATLNHKYV
jgi:hypothetical protein